MVNTVSVGIAGTPASRAPPDPAELAARIVRDNSHGGRPNLSEIKRDLNAVAAQDPELGAAVAREVDARLTPVQRGQLAAASYAARAPDGQALVFQDDAPSVADYRAQAPGSAGRAFYDRLDRIWGDGGHATNDTARIQAGLRQMQASGLSLAQHEATAQTAAATPPAAPPVGPSTATLALDLTTMALDIVGIFDPTPISDGSSAVISAGRAIGSVFQGDWGEAGGHLGNGPISAAGILWGVGDAAKIAKIGKWAQTVTDAVQAIALNPALRTTLEPGLRAIRDAVSSIPAGVLDSLPQSARESLERMKGQLDAFFAGGSRQADEATSGDYRATVRGEGVSLPGVDAIPVNYVKRDRDAYQALRREFDSRVRGEFARGLASDPAKVDALRRAGLDDAAIGRLASGRVPQGWQVHHKLPLDDGGTNAFENLVLIKNDPHHIALTNEQRRLVGDLTVGQARQVDFPVPRGFVYPPVP